MIQLAHSDEAFECTDTECTVGADDFDTYHEQHHHQMMEGGGMMMGGFGMGSGATFALTGWITWILIVVLLIAAIRWVWKQGG